MTPLLELRNLSVSFTLAGEIFFAVRNLSYSLGEGEILALVGESGSGKSISAKALLGLHPKESHISGEILYNGRNLLALSPKELEAIRGKEIGIIFQDPATSLNPTMKVGVQILENLQNHCKKLSKEEAREKVYALLRLVEIPNPEIRYEQYPHQLSGGLQQRVMIAMTLAPKPRILLADEPTTALDKTTEKHIIKLLQEIQKALQMTIIFITHDLRLAASFSSKVLVLYRGELMEMAPTAALFSSPQHPYTQKLLSSLLSLSKPHKGPLESIEGSPPPAWQKIEGCPFHPRCPSSTALCKKEAPPLTSFSSEQKVSCWQHLPS